MTFKNKMENISKLLAQSESSNDDSDDESMVSGFFNTSSAVRSRYYSSTSTEKDLAQQNTRQPTRRPDPSVLNRNALMARENRRRKKVHLETIEKELDDVRDTNKMLLKALKKQMKRTQRLEQEKSYFKNILVNRTEILKLMSAINSQMQNRGPSLLSRCSSSSSIDLAPMQAHSVSASGSNADEGSVATKQNCDSLFDGVSNYLDEFFTDLQPLTADSAVGDSWNELLQDDDFGLGSTCVSPYSSEGNTSTEYQVVDDHSYVTLPNINNENENISSMLNIDNTDSGVCLHIARGKVSLEFCPSCHWKAGSTPPTQLLQNDFDKTID